MSPFRFIRVLFFWTFVVIFIAAVVLDASKKDEGAGGVPPSPDQLCPDGTFVESYGTPSFEVWICRLSDDSLTYNETSKAGDNFVSIPGATPGAGGFDVRADDTVYHIDDRELRVTNREGIILREDVIH